MLKKYSLIALQKAMHHALMLDESMPKKLTELEGSTLKIEVTPLGVHFYMRFSEGRLLLLQEYEGAVDTCIESSPLGFIRLSLLPPSRVRSLFNEQIKITGDVLLGQKVQQLFTELDIDWEGHLAHLTGDAIAYQLSQWVRLGLKKQKSWRTSTRETLTEYLQEELRLCPSREEMRDFIDSVDALSLQVERLSAHVAQMNQSDAHEIH